MQPSPRSCTFFQNDVHEYNDIYAECLFQQDWLTLPQILGAAGLSFSSLPKHEAMEIGLAMVAENQHAFGHCFPARVHSIDILTRYWYVKSSGLEKSKSKSTEEDMLVDGGKSALCALLAGEAPSPADGHQVKVEHVHHAKLQTSCSALRPAYAGNMRYDISMHADMPVNTASCYQGSAEAIGGFPGCPADIEGQGSLEDYQRAPLCQV